MSHTNTRTQKRNAMQWLGRTVKFSPQTTQQLQMLPGTLGSKSNILWYYHTNNMLTMHSFSGNIKINAITFKLLVICV